LPITSSLLIAGVGRLFYTDRMSDASPTAADEPWYRDGLRFTCTQCGNCCTGAPGVVWVTDAEIERIAAHTGRSVGEVRLFHTRIVGGRVSLTEFGNGDCTFFDGATRRCKVYPVRPTQCRTWPFWQSNLEDEDVWAQVCRSCPGAGQGEFVPLAEIERRASQVDV
jgi:Fe-S-cluster containining protein